jgi:hypothetical protein
MRVTSGGNIGIGTATPTALLMLQGPATGNGLFIRAGETDNVDYLLRVDDEDGTLQAMWIDANGNTGIRTSTPRSILSVNGNAAIGTYGAATSLTDLL